MHCCDHVGSLFALAVNEQVVSFFYAVPAVVTVHGVETAYDRCYHAGALGAVLFNLADEPYTAAGVCVATVHKAVQIHFFEAVVLGDVAQGVHVVERRVHTAGRGEAHEVHGLACGGAVFECLFDFRIVVDFARFNGFVDFYEVLIHDAACADVEVAYLGVAHLAVGQTDKFAAGLQFGVGICLDKIVPVRGWCAVDGVGMVVLANAPAVKDDK